MNLPHNTNFCPWTSSQGRNWAVQNRQGSPGLALLLRISVRSSMLSYPYGSCLQSLVRFVDRDMVMRYLWGLGVGHVYTHLRRPSSRLNIVATATENTSSGESQDVEMRSGGDLHLDIQVQDERDNEDDLEFGLEDREFDDWDIDEGEESDSELHDEEMAADATRVSIEYDFYE